MVILLLFTHDMNALVDTNLGKKLPKNDATVNQIILHFTQNTKHFDQELLSLNSRLPWTWSCRFGLSKLKNLRRRRKPRLRQPSKLEEVLTLTSSLFWHKQ